MPCRTPSDIELSRRGFFVPGAAHMSQVLVPYDALKTTGITFSRMHIWRLEKAGKFPVHVPVSAQAMRSLPASESEITAVWIGRVSVNPRSRMPSSNRGSRLSDVNGTGVVSQGVGSRAGACDVAWRGAGEWEPRRERPRGARRGRRGEW